MLTGDEAVVGKANWFGTAAVLRCDKTVAGKMNWFGIATALTTGKTVAGIGTFILGEANAEVSSKACRSGSRNNQLFVSFLVIPL